MQTYFLFLRWCCCYRLFWQHISSFLMHKILLSALKLSVLVIIRHNVVFITFVSWPFESFKELPCIHYLSSFNKVVSLFSLVALDCGLMVMNIPRNRDSPFSKSSHISYLSYLHCKYPYVHYRKSKPFLPSVSHPYLCSPDMPHRLVGSLHIKLLR